jgi:hypothetical protein
MESAGLLNPAAPCPGLITRQNTYDTDKTDGSNWGVKRTENLNL